MEENNIQNKSMWQEAASSQNPLPETKKNFPVLLILFIIIFIFLIVISVFFIMKSQTKTPEEKKTTTQSAQRSFNIEEATKEASTKNTEDNLNEDITELNNLDDELDTTLTDLENSLTDIGDYQSQDDNMPSL